VIAVILNSYLLLLSWLRQLVADVPDDMFTAQRAGAVNHPAWVIGHLIYSAEAIGGEIGLAPWLPADWASRFGTGSVPTADRQTYPNKASLLDSLSDAEVRLRDRLLSIGDDGMMEPLPDIGHRESFPTIGHAVLHILTSHAALHIGQLTVWRRVMGYGPLEKPLI
jgi:hypothetical protein